MNFHIKDLILHNGVNMYLMSNSLFIVSTQL